MANVLLVPHRSRSNARTVAEDVVTWLRAHDHVMRMAASDVVGQELSDIEVRPDTLAAEDADVVISIGGDGTMLHSVNLAAHAGVPILGINAGNLGYLTSVGADDALWAIAQYFNGNFAIEERMTLQLVVKSQEETKSRRTILNEIVVEKTVPGHTVRMSISINGTPFLTYAADGMILATPTGSTAYNLSARGPILSPKLNALVMTPVSPHMLFDRSIVLRGDETVGIDVLESRPANLVVDGMYLGTLQPGDSVACLPGEHSARLIAFGSRDMHTVLRNKFGLSDR